MGDAQIISALIVDDESLGRDLVRHMLQAHPDIQVVGECADGVKAMAAIKRLDPTIVFLDIRMPKVDGIDLLGRLATNSGQHPLIVFITAYEEYAIKAFEAHALDYLLKPFDQERFDHTIKRIRERLRQVEEAKLGKSLRGLLDGQLKPKLFADRVVVRESGRIYFVGVAEVDWLEASGNYVTLHVGGKTHLVHETMANMLTKLDPAVFVRIHRSTIVNVNRIKEMTPFFNGEYIVVLKDDTELKLSRGYAEKAKTAFGLFE
jgi:two-component system, LytTR family, response regulator